MKVNLEDLQGKMSANNNNQSIFKRFLKRIYIRIDYTEIPDFSLPGGLGYYMRNHQTMPKYFETSRVIRANNAKRNGRELDSVRYNYNVDETEVLFHYSASTELIGANINFDIGKDFMGISCEYESNNYNLDNLIFFMCMIYKQIRDYDVYSRITRIGYRHSFGYTSTSLDEAIKNFDIMGEINPEEQLEKGRVSIQKSNSNRLWDKENDYFYDIYKNFKFNPGEHPSFNLTLDIDISKVFDRNKDDFKDVINDFKRVLYGMNSATKTLFNENLNLEITCPIVNSQQFSANE